MTAATAILPSSLAVLDPHHTTFALHANAFRERDFWRKREREADGRSLLDG